MLLIIMGGCFMLVTIIGLRYRPLRYMEDELPDAVPDAVIMDDKDHLQQHFDQQLEMEVE